LAAVETTVQATVYASDGTLVGEMMLTVAPNALVQLDRVLADQLGYTGPAFATLTTTDEAASYAAYVSVVDGGTGDPAFIPGVAVAAR
jgi:hypothetical protein